MTLKDLVIRQQVTGESDNELVTEWIVANGKDKEIERLHKIIDSQKRHIDSIEQHFCGRGTKRTGNVILDFKLEIRKQVCDEIREFIDNNEHSEENDTKQSSESVIYTSQLYKFLDKIEQAKN